MGHDAIFIYDPLELNYRFNDGHPFNPLRLQLTIDLLEQMGLLTESRLRKPRVALEEELLWVHTPAYIDTVKALSVPKPDESVLQRAASFGLHSEDTPYFQNMHQVTSAIVGGSLLAAEQVMTGQTKHALHLSGGLHHAMPHKGAGFCVYNDASVAIAYVRRHYGAKVLYIDTDVHHGDGVQWSFYTEPEVCTLSIHETGRFLFPGTGGVQERGEGEGFGFAYNIPLEPYTEDDSWLECFQESLSKVIAAFRPDVIISQHGCDAHAYDPLAHLQCSMKTYVQIPHLIHELAHQWCDGRWIALGGGGYDIWRVVPRAWSLLWMNMIEDPVIPALLKNEQISLPAEWLTKWQPASPQPLPATWLDPIDAWEPMPRRKEITEKNKKTKELALQYLPK